MRFHTVSLHDVRIESTYQPTHGVHNGWVECESFPNHVHLDACFTTGADKAIRMSGAATQESSNGDGCLAEGVSISSTSKRKQVFSRAGKRCRLHKGQHASSLWRRHCLSLNPGIGFVSPHRSIHCVCPIASKQAAAP